MSITVQMAPRTRSLGRCGKARARTTVMCFALAFWGQTALGRAEPRCLAIVGTNDVHGAIEAQTVFSQDRRGEVSVGGIRVFSGYVQALRQTFGDRLLLLDAGDMLWGTLASNMAQGRPVVAAYNALGYTAATLGNHEFDFGASPAHPTERQSVLQERLVEADFPFLAANFYAEATGALPLWHNLFPSILRDVGGVRVGIIGALTPTTPQTTRPAHVAGLRFTDPRAGVEAEAQSLRRRGAELIVLLAHMGGRCAETLDPNDVTSCNVDAQGAELFALLRALPPHTVDVAIGGHTHQQIAHWVFDTAVIESGARGQKFGYLEACLRPDGKPGLFRERSVIYPPVDICETTWTDGTCRAKQHATPTGPARFLGRVITPMPQVIEATKPSLDAVRVKSAQLTGIDLPRAVSAFELSQLVAEAMRRSQHADFGLQNRGGIRAGLARGPVTFGQLYEAVPFDNEVAVVRLTAAALETFLGRLYAHNVGPEGHTLVGIRKNSRDAPTFVTDKGAPLDLHASYTLATTDFMLEGGDGAPRARGPMRLAEVSMREALLHLLRELYPATA